MKQGDVVMFKDRMFASYRLAYAIIWKVHMTKHGTGQIHLINSKVGAMTIPWVTRDKYIEVVIES